MAGGFSVRADADGVADGSLAPVDVVGCEGLASASAFVFSGPHAHATSTTQADNATLTIVRAFIRSPRSHHQPTTHQDIKTPRRIRVNGSRAGPGVVIGAALVASTPARKPLIELPGSWLSGAWEKMRS
ncbi:hypothetical protein [Streptomyces sp. NPDC127118]|uniref:hypothetical protein n=1 Tax=Streptomyces sp. NPDC127118 TaxID=3345369 RepID=UPI0036305C9C